MIPEPINTSSLDKRTRPSTRLLQFLVDIEQLCIRSLYKLSFNQRSDSANTVTRVGHCTILERRKKQGMMQPIYFAIPLGCLLVLIVVTNICVCLLVYTYNSLRTFTNGLVVSLAVSDVLTGALVLPLYITVPAFPGTNYIVSVVMLTGIANQCAVTLDRYLAVKRPFIYHAVMEKHFWKLIAASWVIPIAISLIPLSFDSEKSLEYRIYLFLLQGLCVIVPYVFVFVAYYQIFQQARIIVKRIRRESSLSWRSEKKKTVRSNDASSEAKVAKMFAVIAITFILSWMPVIYLTSVLAATKDEELLRLLSPVWLIDASLFTIALGSMVNPVIYSFFKPDFRRILKKLLRKATPKRKQKYPSFNVSLIVSRLESGKDGRETDL